MKMSRQNKGCTDWMDNEEWYYIDEERDRYVLTDKAPEEARRSFEMWKKMNNLDWDELDSSIAETLWRFER